MSQSPAPGWLPKKQKFGADSPEIAEDVLDRHIEQARQSIVGRLIMWLVFAAVYVVAFGVAWLALSAAIYGVYRLVRWTVGWF